MIKQEVISDTFTVHIPGEVIKDPNEGFNRLPTADSDELEYGDYYFDLYALALAMAGPDATEEEIAENMEILSVYDGKMKSCQTKKESGSLKRKTKS